MKTATVPMLLTLAFYLTQDAASGKENQDPCTKFQALIKNGKLSCSQGNSSSQHLNDIIFQSECILCKKTLKQRATTKNMTSVRFLSRATRATAPAKLNCENFTQRSKDADFICPYEPSAVCGTDGKTYHSRCELCAENAKSQNHVDIKSEGECGSSHLETDMCSDFRAYVQDGRLGCTRENDPIRGPDGRTHGNRCAMCAELFLKEAQENATRHRESRIRRDAEEELCKEFKNQVRSGRLFCTRESDPIRGPDGKMHGNKCALCAEIFMKRFTEERGKAEKNQRDAEERAKAKMEIKKRCSEFQDRAKNGTLFCTRENDPIRGLDGKTHGNLCSMCQAFFKTEAEENKTEAGTRNRRGSEKSETYAKLCDGFRKARKNGQLYCTRENDPVRGPDGKIHGNTCSMCQAFFIQEDKARAKVKREAAKEMCSEFRNQAKNGMLMCTRENDPVVGPDGKTHSNKCAMCASVFLLEEEEKKKDDKREKKKVEAGKVKREAVQELCSKYRTQLRNGRLPCTRKNEPTESLDGKIYKSTCSMCETFFQQEAKEKAAGFRAKAKREVKVDCSEFLTLLKGGKLYCTRENDPVRGPDGKTHGNKCAMCKAVFEKENEERKRKEGENQRISAGQSSSGAKAKYECAQYWERMKNGELSCTRESEPVRGADGKSYNNECVMCKELLQRELDEKNKNSASRSNGTRSEKKDVCDEFRSQMKNGKLLCTRESDPTRGPDGKTHGNKCAMCKERLEREAAEKKKKEDEDKRNTGENKSDKEDQCHEFRSMQLDGRLICTRENDPIQGPDGKTHVNKCAMCQMIFDREASERKMRDEENSRSRPTNEAKDQCGEVHNTPEDVKPRQARSSLPSIHEISEDACSEFRNLMKNEKFICPEMDDPVHGADGAIYQNKCYMCRDVLEKEALERSELQEKSSHIRSTKEGGPEFSSSSLDSDMCKNYRILPRMGYLCPRNLNPVCGDDGQTYDNPCMLCHENLMRQTNTQIHKQGKCEESSNLETVSVGTPSSEKMMQ
ncbi:serine protease inhibitor Kazal-type 5 [Grammomys surdaster]|uniref:serine protease inhibitor Kazal-type 5 n=1 Tax=Grammomys surdaster TaxID=491861 RepID=UPI00109FB0C7|nr:serine protease inhibitor Kazal-type 5 [Grammomys surdaster]